MKRISFDPRFVNEAGNNLIPGKIHTIRKNYDYWKHFEGEEVTLFTWEGKPYRSKQKVFCVKRIVSVQSVYYMQGYFWGNGGFHKSIMDTSQMAKNDGFDDYKDFLLWFEKGNYKPGKMAVLHFADFKY